MANKSRKELLGTPAYLVAIARAAHETGDLTLATAASQELLSRFGIKISFSEPESKLTVGSRLEEGDTNE